MYPPLNFKKHGVTLTEVMVALSFITIAIFGLLSVNLYAAKGQSASKERQMATVLAVSEMEDAERELRHEFTTNIDKLKTPSTFRPDFEISRTATLVGGRPDLKRIDINIYWEDKNGPQTHNLWTYFYDRSR